MPEIRTVRGPIDSAELGFTSMHEHILYDGRLFRRRFEAFIPPDAPVKPDEPVRLDNLGQLKHGFIMSLDAIVMVEAGAKVDGESLQAAGLVKYADRPIKLLGRGQVEATINALGPTRLWETRFPGVWVVDYSNAEDQRLDLSEM